MAPQNGFHDEVGPILYGAVRENQIQLLREKGLSLISTRKELETTSLSKHPAINLLPAFHRCVADYLVKRMAGLDPEISIVMGYTQGGPRELPIQGIAHRTDDDIGIPKSFLIQIYVDSIAEIFSVADYLTNIQPLFTPFRITRLPDIKLGESSVELMYRAIFGPMFLLFFHELGHVVRNHHALMNVNKIVDDLALVGESDYARRRRIVEDDADFYGAISLAECYANLPPGLPTPAHQQKEYQYLRCLLSAFIMFSAFEKYSPVGDAGRDESKRYYNSPLVRFHVLPLAFGSTLGVPNAQADDLFARFYDALQIASDVLPMLSNYRDRQAELDKDLAHWRTTETERVQWQDAGHFTSLFPGFRKDP